MTHEGRMARGKWNVDNNKFLKNPETLYYLSESKQETDVSYADMTKAELVKAAEGLELTGKETKDDLVVLLENKSDAEIVEAE